jgi:RNA polymerase sigma-70 factor (ECF subfamily)
MSLPAEVFETNRSLLWALCYRMTGSTADADDLVQETFIKALENPPRRADEPLRPWLVRVALNLSRDHLRRRRRRQYIGPWLPSPMPTDDCDNPASYEPVAGPEDAPMARYEMLESISFAFLLALEVLTPMQRAVLLLRDVFDYSTAETAQALAVTEANVKVVLHRARRRMRAYDARRARLDKTHCEATRRALEQFVLYLRTRNAEGLERLLTEDVVSVSDGGGTVAAARVPICGRQRVVRLLLGLAQKIGPSPYVTWRTLNGLPALVVEIDQKRPRWAWRRTTHCEVDDTGRICRLYHVLAPDKLAAL